LIAAYLPPPSTKEDSMRAVRIALFKTAIAGMTLCPLVGEAVARTIRVNSCVATIGTFCPVETGGGILFVLAALFLAGIPLRWLLRRHIQSRLAGNPEYKPSGELMWLYGNAGRITLFVIFALGITIAVTMG
jgi:hypothetical protein